MKIALLGDIAPFGRYCVHRNPAVLSQFAGVREFLSGHDLVIGNLETPFVDGERARGAKSAHIHAHPDNIDLLSYLGVTHVTLANNHIGDYGVAGYNRTKNTLEAAGIRWFGTEGRSLRLEVGGEKISLSGYCSWNTNPALLKDAREEILNTLDVDSVIAIMDKDSRDGFLPVLAIHSGQEHVHAPSVEDVEFARGLTSGFRYIYYGHHPHVVQGAETVGGSSIFYSLGNFVFDDVFTQRNHHEPLIRLSEANKTGVIASIDVVGGEVCGWSLTPTYLGTSQVEVGDQVSGFDMAPYNEALKFVGTDAYAKRRLAAIESYISSRREMRDLKWYLKRLNLNSVGILAAARRNARSHHEEFSAKLYKLKGLQ